MITSSELAAKLGSWADECFNGSEEQVVIPQRLWKFLANRLTEMGIAREDPDVVTVTLSGQQRKVKVTGFLHGGLIQCEFTDGSQGIMLIQVHQVSPADRNKLTETLERLNSSGHS